MALSFRSLNELVSHLHAHLGKLPVRALVLDPLPHDVPVVSEHERAACSEALLDLSTRRSGGISLFGVTGGVAIGVADGNATRRAVRVIGRELGLTEFEFEPAMVGGKRVVVAHVRADPARRPAPDRAVLPDGDIYVPDAATQARLLRDAPRSPISPDDDTAPLVTLGALRYRDGFAVPTIAGALVLGGDPALALPGAAISVEDTQGRADLRRGPTLALIRRIARSAADPTVQGAVEELLLNAFLHRDWSPESRAIPVRVVASNRAVDVISPGELAGGLARNPTLVDLARRAGWCAGEGRGLDRLRATGEGDLDVRSVGGSTRATWTLRVRARPTSERQQAAVPPPAAPRAPAIRITEVAPGLSDGEAKAYAALAASAGMSRQELEEALGCSRSTARDLLEGLVSRGLVVRSAPSPRSPFQRYSVAGGAKGRWPDRDGAARRAPRARSDRPSSSGVEHLKTTSASIW